jgi:hypothetical protein
MTMHELFTLIEVINQPFCSRDLAEVYSGDKHDIYDAIERAKRFKLVTIHKKIGKQKYFFTTVFGNNKKLWWDENGCNSDFCSCHKNN